MNDKLEIIDENENVIGTDTRVNIHKKGLLHKEINVWFITPNKKVIFQKRAKNKDTFPGLLDSTVGGHVETGDDYLETAVKEIEEETGQKIQKKDLTLITKEISKSFDPKTGTINNRSKVIFTYNYDGKTDDLRIEEGDAEGFEAWPIEELLSIKGRDQAKFVPSILKEDFKNMLKNL